MFYVLGIVHAMSLKSVVVRMMIVLIVTANGVSLHSFCCAGMCTFVSPRRKQCHTIPLADELHKYYEFESTSHKTIKAAPLERYHAHRPLFGFDYSTAQPDRAIFVRRIRDLGSSVEKINYLYLGGIFYR